tara:strand:- start:2592 stop:3092 length:501 start_codon:yes stop_codon:yes gene_type:complete
MSKHCKSISDSWLGQWKKDNDDVWRPIIYRMGFPQSFLMKYSSKEEMDDFCNELREEKRRYQKNTQHNLWQYCMPVSEMFRTFRKMIRTRHEAGFDKNKLYYVHSKVYGYRPVGKWSRGHWLSMPKGTVACYIGKNPAGEPEFMFNGTNIIQLTGAQLQKVRALES